MRRVLSPMAWRMSARGARNVALASVLSLLVAMGLLLVEGIRGSRLDLLVVAAVLVLLLAMAWSSSRWQTEAKGDR